MAAEATRAPGAREQESVARRPGTVAAIARRIHEARQPAVEHRAPTVHDLRQATVELGLTIERARTAHQIVCNDMNDRLVNGDTLTDQQRNTASDLWVAFLAIGDLLAGAHRLADGVETAALQAVRS